MKTVFIVLISEKGGKEAEAELEDIIAHKLSHLKNWRLKKRSVIET